MATLQGKGAITTLQAGDFVSIHDISSTAEDAAGDLKKITVANLDTHLAATTKTLTNKTIDGGSSASQTNAVQVRRDTAANFTSNNPTLSAGEIGYETDTGQFKVGDGSTAWTSLDYVSVGAASIAEVNTGTSTSVAVTPDALAGSNLGTQVVTICLFDDSEDVATGDGAGDQLFRIPSTMNGMNLVAVAAYHQTAGTGTGVQTTDVQIHNVTSAADILSTKLTIDEDETDSSTAATAAVINAAEDDVATGDKLRFDVDAVTGTTAPKGLWVELQFRLP